LSVPLCSIEGGAFPESRNDSGRNRDYDARFRQRSFDAWPVCVAWHCAQQDACRPAFIRASIAG
jgi:hypothetical protein